MHEMHIVRDLFEDILKRAKENDIIKVTRVYLRMGDFTEINEEILRYYFKENGENTPLADVEVTIEKSPTRELSLLSFDGE